MSPTPAPPNDCGLRCPMSGASSANMTAESPILISAYRRLSRFVHEFSGRRLVRQRPAEVHLDVDDLVAAGRHDLRVAERVTRTRASFVRDEHAIASRHEIHECKALDVLAVRPAPCEIARAIDAVVERAREMKIRGEQA